jgi:hypothetical protein
MFDVFYKTLDSTDVANFFVSLTDGPPIDTTNVALDIIGGTAQYLSASGDFGVEGTKVVWDNVSFALHYIMEIGDRIRVIYDRT